jgi:hypothetical protein
VRRRRIQNAEGAKEINPTGFSGLEATAFFQGWQEFFSS